MRQLLCMYLSAKCAHSKANAVYYGSGFWNAFRNAFAFALYSRMLRALAKTQDVTRAVSRYKLARKSDVRAVLDTFGERIDVGSISPHGITLANGSRIVRGANGAVPCWYLVGFSTDNSDVEAILNNPKLASVSAVPVPVK